MENSNKRVVVGFSAAAAAVGLSAIVWTITARKKKGDKRKSSKPPVGPSLTDLLRVQAEGTFFEHQFLWTEQHGLTFTMPSPLPMLISDYVAVADPHLTWELCVTEANQYRNPSRFTTRSDLFAKAVRDSVGRSLASSTGDEWKWRRAAFLKEMHKSKLMNPDRQLMEFLFETGQRVLCQQLAQAAASGDVLRVDVVATEAALDTILYFMFGKVPSSTYNPDEVRQAAKDTLGYMQASLVPGFFHVAKYVPGTSAREWLRKRNAAWKVLDDIFSGELQILMHERSGKQPRCPDRKPGSILEQWLSSEPNFYERSLDPIVAECRGMILAGFETTAHSLAYCFGMMAEHKELSRQLCEISSKVLAEHGNDAKAVLEGSDFVKYFFMEAVRLYPLAPALAGITTDDIRVKDSKGTEYEFAKDTNFVFLNGVLQRQADYCGKPSQDGVDPNQVDPTRWMQGTSTKDQPFLHVFNTGAHSCAGKPLAMLEGHVFLILVASQFDFEFPEGVSKVQYDENLLLRPKDAMPLRVKTRNLEK